MVLKLPIFLLRFQSRTVAPYYYGKDVREVAAVISTTILFIGADNGILHLAIASQTTPVGLFSVTNISTYRPYGNGSISIDTRSANPREIVKTVGALLQDGE